MNKVLAVTLGVLLASCVVVFPVESANTVKFGGKFEDGVSQTLTASQKFNKEWERAQVETETSYYLTKVDGIEKTNRGSGEYEVLYSFFPTHYGIATTGFTYNKFRAAEVRGHYGLGWGWKLYRDENWKVSNEVTAVRMNDSLNEDTVFRNSLWIRFSVPETKTKVTNKFLVEEGELHEVTKNELSLSYQLNSKVSFSLTNKFVDDKSDEKYKVTFFSLGYTF